MQPGITERQIANEFECQARELGASGIINDPVIASGKRSALPHGRATERVIQVGDPLTIDLTPARSGYPDVTRTFHFGEPPERFKEMYAVVAEAQKHAQDAVRPGVLASEINAVAKTTIAAAGYGNYIEHSVGHGVGLDIHEMPFLNSEADPVVLEPGMVVTVEPGVYVPDYGGVRIENSVAVSPTGAEPLNHFTLDLLRL